jgi:hypothetical protein
MEIPADSRGMESLARVPEWQQCEIKFLDMVFFLSPTYPSYLMIFILPILDRNLSGMSLNGTLGYNMNLLTALVQLLVRSLSSKHQCSDGYMINFSKVLI